MKHARFRLLLASVGLPLMILGATPASADDNPNSWRNGNATALALLHRVVLRQQVA